MALEHLPLTIMHGVHKGPIVTLGAHGYLSNDKNELWCRNIVLQPIMTLINEDQWRFTGIKTPVVEQQISEVLEEPFVWYEEPIVIEPRETTKSSRLNNGDVTERCSKRNSWNVYRRQYIKAGILTGL